MILTFPRMRSLTILTFQEMMGYNFLQNDLDCKVYFQGICLQNCSMCVQTVT